MSSDCKELVELTGVFTQQKYRNGDGSYCVCLYKVKSDYVTVVGSDLPEVDYPVTFSGKWITHPAFGEQFQVDMIVNQLPKTKREIVSFILSTSAGLTWRQAEHMVSLAGTADIWELLYESPMIFCSDKKITEDRVLRLQAEVKRQTTQRDLLRLFGKDLEMNTQQYRRICSLFSEDMSTMIDSIRENPFVLIGAGYSFKDLDKFSATHTEFCVNDYRRLLGASQDILLDAQRSCHVGLPASIMLTRLKDALRPVGTVGDLDCRAFLREACVRKDLVFANELFYLRRAYEEESVITRRLAAMAELTPRNVDRKKFDKCIEAYGKDKGITLSADQTNAVWTAITRQICIITGGPGTGKSTILDAILFSWKKFHKDSDWLLMAPTGKAAVRMTETTGESAYTIHSTLQLGVQTGFEHKEEVEAEIENSLIVVDESSMLDLSVASALVGALSNIYSGKQHLILVGDPDQLPSVSYGNVLADLISSDVIPVCSLNTIYRQAAENPIVTNSLRIRADNDDLVWGGDFKRFHEGSDARNMDVACNFFVRCVKQFGIENVALLSPFHNKTEISTNVLNRKLQETINPANGRPGIKGIGGISFRVKDRVMQLRNTEWLSNGDVGTVIDVDPFADSGDLCLTVEFENGIVQGYTRDDLTQLDLAYAFSIHKSQGSQYKCVIIVLPNETSSFLTRSILYTGITRAKAHVALIGPTATIRFMIHNERQDVRHTRLIQRLRVIKEKIDEVLQDAAEE